MAIYDNNGSTNYEFGHIYDNNGSTNYEFGYVYDNNGSTNYELYSAEQVFLNAASSVGITGWSFKGNNEYANTNGVYVSFNSWTDTFDSGLAYKKLTGLKCKKLTIVYSNTTNAFGNGFSSISIGTDGEPDVYTNDYSTIGGVACRLLTGSTAHTNATLTWTFNSVIDLSNYYIRFYVVGNHASGTITVKSIIGTE